MNQISKIAAAASLGLAMIFAFSCSSGDDSDNSHSGETPLSSSGVEQSGGASSSSGAGALAASSSSLQAAGSSSSSAEAGVSSSAALPSSQSSSSSLSAISEISSSSEEECPVTNSALNCAVIKVEPSSSSGGVIKSSSSSFAGQGGKIQGAPVTYHGEDYPTVVIGTQTWFAKNLNYETEGKYYVSGTIKNGWDGSFCYLQNPAKCEEYGRLYNWHAVMNIPESCVEANNCASYINTPHQGICPAGWHIPTKEEWWDLILFVNFDNLEELIDGNGVYDTYLKAKSGWHASSLWDNKDTYGFAALPGGYIDNPPGTFQSSNQTVEGYWWTSSLDFHYIAGSPYVAGMDDAMGEVVLFNKNLSADSFIKYYNFSVRCLKD